MAETAEEIGRLTLVYDDILSNPELRKLWDEFDDDLTPGRLAYHDQLDKATDGAVRFAEAGIAAGLYRDDTAPLHGPTVPDWVRLGAINALVTWSVDAGRTCMHFPTAGRPEPVFAAAWKPGLVVCGRCDRLLAYRRGSVRDRTCDGCGRVVAGDTADPIAPSAVRIKSFMWQFGACLDCQFWD